MDKFIIVDIETGGFDVEDGIKELAAIVVEDNIIKDKLHIGIVEDENLINLGYGQGYQDISENKECIATFKEFLNKYDYPIVAHYANFDRKFLLYYEWIDEDYEMYDSIRAIKYENPYLFSYALNYLISFYELGRDQSHTAFGDVMDLYEILNIVNPKTWIPLGASVRKKRMNSKPIDVNEIDVEVIGEEFKDKNIVFTGKGPYERKYLSVMAIKQGAIIQKGVNKQTDILVVGEGAGQKLQKAMEKGIEILEIEDFMDRVSHENILQIKNTISNVSNSIVKSHPILDLIEDYSLSGKLISLVPMRHKLADKIGTIIEELGGSYITSLRQKETDLLVYEEYGEDFVTVSKAKNKNIKCLSLSEFNRLILEKQFDNL